MAHQESVLSPETDLLILSPVRPYTALLMTLCCKCVRAHIPNDACLSLSMCMHTGFLFICLCVNDKKKEKTC